MALGGIILGKKLIQLSDFLPQKNHRNLSFLIQSAMILGTHGIIK
jgi:hypothetical protein